MGIAVSLFFSANDPEKQTLHRRITPNSEQMADQQKRWNELRGYLLADLQQTLGIPMRSWLQGSYKFRTQVRPARSGEEFDIDLGIFYCWPGDAERGPFTNAQLRQETQASILRYAKTAQDVKSVDVPAKPRCARIRYDGDFHIDVPSYHLDPAADDRTLAAKDQWEFSDPKAIYLWFKNRFDDTTRAKVRRQIRYIKFWSQLKWTIEGGRPSSVLISVLVAEAFDSLEDEDLGSDDDTLLGVLRHLSRRVGRSQRVRNPVNPSEDLNRLSEEQWTAFKKEIDALIEIAEAACASTDEIDAADLWSKAFGHFFPMPNVSTASDARLSKANALVAVSDPDVEVSAVARNNPAIRYKGLNSLPTIPKDCDITFRLLEPGKLPSGATVEWVVRNEGPEAENINDLGHRAGNRYVATERSLYAGRHYMDCLIRSGGRIVGMRRISVTISGISAPPRNPAKRPAYAWL